MNVFEMSTTSQHDVVSTSSSSISASNSITLNNITSLANGSPILGRSYFWPSTSNCRTNSFGLSIFSQTALVSKTSIATAHSNFVSAYSEVGQALGEMASSDTDDDWKIEPAVINNANLVAIELMANAYPAPRIFSHGSKSVVFNWELNDKNIYLTISENKLSALVSNQETITFQKVFSGNEILERTYALLTIRSAQADQNFVSSAGSSTDALDISL